jgi:homoserine kinase type II
MYQNPTLLVQKSIEFLMASLTSFTLSDARQLLEGYDEPEPVGVVPIVSGTVNSSYAIDFPGHRRFLRIYEEQDHDGAVVEASRLGLLASRGVRTPPPLPKRDGTFLTTVQGKPAVLFPWVDGKMRCLALVTPGDARRVGAALAELHRAGRDAPRSPGRFEPEHLTARLDRIAAAPFPAIAAQAEPLRAKLAHWVARRATGLPRGLVHGDVFRDNVLWDDEGEISALLDFESASDGVLVYDLMVTVLAWSFRDELSPAIAAALVAGYEIVRPLEEEERSGLLAEACVAAIRFTITRLTDAELRAAELGHPPRRDKDWRRFAMRLGVLERLGTEGLGMALGIATQSS